jgi:hypothetical protein
MTMQTVTHFSADHTLAFDAALQGARLELPATADAARADRGLCLALNGHVTLEGGAVAHVTSERDPEVVYQVTRTGCDCYDARRRAEQMPDARPGVRGCKHYYAAVLVAMAHVNLVLKGYVPEPDGEVCYPAVSLEEWAYGVGGWAFPQADGSYWFEPRTARPGWYTDSTSLELWDKRPCHETAWHGAVSRWERWLQG